MSDLYNINVDFDDVANILDEYNIDYHECSRTFTTTPSCPHYALGEYVDENKSVKWNKEEIKKRNAIYKVEKESLLLEKDKALYNIKEKYADKLSLLFPTLTNKEIIYAIDVTDDKQHGSDCYIDTEYYIYMLLLYLANIKTFKEKM